MKLLDSLRAACQGRQKSLGLELFGDFGEQEISRYLRGERGEKMLTLLEAAWDANPSALADYCTARFGWKIEKPAEPMAVQMELFGARLHTLVTDFAQFAELAIAQQGRAPVARVSPPERDGRRRA